MSDVLFFLIGLALGAAALAIYQIARAVMRGVSIKDAGKAIISGGGGPGSGETPK